MKGKSKKVQIIGIPLNLYLYLAFATWFLSAVVISGLAIAIITVPNVSKRLRTLAALISLLGTLLKTWNIFYFIYLTVQYKNSETIDFQANVVLICFSFFLLTLSLWLTIEIFKMI